METDLVSVRTGSQPAIRDLTTAAASFLTDAAAGDGLLNVFVPHATAGVAIMELGSGSEEDLLAILERVLPHADRWRHCHGSPGHGADHVLPLLVSASVSVPVIDGRLALGTWQSIALVDTNADNPIRDVRFSFIPG